jgi:hypothetical protein
MVTTNKHRFNKRYGQPKDTPNSKAKIARLTGISKSILDKVYDRGVGAFKTNRGAVRPNVKSPEQWAQARVYSFVVGGKTRQTADKDLWEKHKKNKARKKKA